MNLHLTAVHCYALQHPETGERQWVLANGGYCDGPGEALIAEQHPGWTVIGSTWRSDWTQLAAPANAEPGYQDDSPGYVAAGEPPWRTSSDPLTVREP